MYFQILEAGNRDAITVAFSLRFTEMVFVFRLGRYAVTILESLRVSHGFYISLADKNLSICG